MISKYAISDKNSDMNTLDELELCTELLFLLYRKVLVWRTLDMKRARTEAGMTSR